MMLNSALAELGSLILAADTAHCLFGYCEYICVSSGTFSGPFFFGHPPPCKQKPFSSLYSDVSLYQPLRARDTKLCT